MNRGFWRITVCVLAASSVLATADISVQAAGISSVLPNGGVNISLAKRTTMERLQAQTGDVSLAVETVLNEQELVKARKVLDDEAAVKEQEVLKNLVIAQVNDYVNVRNTPNTKGEVVGKLYNNSVGTLLGEEQGWYYIQSGTVAGYVKAEYCVVGEAAAELAQEVCTRLATVNTETLKVHTEPGFETEVLTLVPYGEVLVVSEELDGWVKVDTAEGSGWIAAEYCELSREYVKAESKEEERARLLKEAEERRVAREAAKKSGKLPKKGVTLKEDTGSEIGRAVAEYALQFVGNPYVWGGTSLTKGADCSGFVMKVYEEFGVSLLHSSALQRKAGYAVDGVKNAQPGDLICYSGHIAIYIGDGQIVHAANSKKGIIVSKASYMKVLAVRRIF